MSRQGIGGVDMGFWAERQSEDYGEGLGGQHGSGTWHSVRLLLIELAGIAPWDFRRPVFGLPQWHLCCLRLVSTGTATHAPGAWQIDLSSALRI